LFFIAVSGEKRLKNTANRTAHHFDAWPEAVIQTQKLRGRFRRVFRRKLIAGIGGFHFPVGSATALKEGVDHVMGAMTAKPADCCEHLPLAKHLGRRRDVLAAEAGNGFFGFVRNRRFVGKDITAGGAGQFFACALKSLVYGFAP